MQECATKVLLLMNRLLDELDEGINMFDKDINKSYKQRSTKCSMN